VLFAIGLMIYLWNMHILVAIPVLLVAFLAIVAYGVSTFLPLLNQYCPYSTPLSKLVQAVREPFSEDKEEDLMDELTSCALSWLIVNYEDIQSVDIALQAIAGASVRLPLAPLRDCQAHVLVAQRLRNCFATRQKTGKPYLKDPGLIEPASMYSRAFAAMQQPAAWSLSSAFLGDDFSLLWSTGMSRFEFNAVTQW
jgi:hypothetical protein